MSASDEYSKDLSHKMQLIIVFIKLVVLAFFFSTSQHFDGLVQERRNSIANALELRLSCTNPLTSGNPCDMHIPVIMLVLTQPMTDNIMK